mmetsp:Transcript_38575/g.101775  ORF Transcript_38575/g.101775 Transcript_38575/m.101775 type:complete len:117 (-) Transcript_38575:707-1057(-)|eukprot:CAMPEP_0115831886 /NCGR_PEP_ID=MMETSP0287-20121206/2370_1 /TAXON_ID=412157 /ORGANISM="Chrysochromulina rotalis, Strain UIO044" /LENGTH=116 /DNA_ID=CAMNT_0003285247 /DNA_START=86 /DNA_END=436 /DNA_ORIENTATION=+
MVLPTGRDFVVPGKPILPGDAELIEAMNRDPVAKPCAGFMWRTFGFNFIAMTIIKYMVLLDGAMMNFYTFFALYGTVAVGLLVTHKAHFEAEKADITPFLALFFLETCAWYAIILS